MGHRLRVQQSRVDPCTPLHQSMVWRVVRRRRGWRSELPRDCKRAPLRRRDAAVAHLRRKGIPVWRGRKLEHTRYMTARISARAVETFPNLVYDPSCLCLGRAEYVVAQVDGQCARGTRHVWQRA